MRYEPAVVKPWAPFHQKEHMFVAPYNWYDKALDENFRDSLFQDDYQGGLHILLHVFGVRPRAKTQK